MRVLDVGLQEFGDDVCSLIGGLAFDVDRGHDSRVTDADVALGIYFVVAAGVRLTFHGHIDDEVGLDRLVAVNRVVADAENAVGGFGGFVGFGLVGFIVGVGESPG